MANLVTSTLYVNPQDIEVIHSNQVNGKPCVSPVPFSYDPFSVELSPRGWLLYAFEAQADDRRQSYSEVADQLDVSVATIKRGKIETRNKKCLPVTDTDRSNPLVSEDLARLYQQNKFAIPIYFAINRFNVRGQFQIHQQVLAEMSRCSKQTVRRAIAALDVRSIVTRRHQHNSDGRQTSDFLRVENMAKPKRNTPVRRNTRKTTKGSNQEGPNRKSGQTGSTLSTSTHNSIRTKGNVSDDTGSSTLHNPSFLSDVKPTHEELIRSGDLLDRITQLSPGSKRLDDLRRPKDSLLFVGIDQHKFLNRLLDDYEYAERYRRKFWQRIFRNDPQSAMKSFRVGPILGEVKDTTTGDTIQVTPELEKLAFKLHTTYKQFVKSRYSMFIRMQLKLKRGTARYHHFIRLAHVIVENRAVRYYRLWMIAQFAVFEEMRESGFMKKRSYPQPNFLYSENAELRFFGYMETRIEDVENRVCVDEGMAGKLRRFAKVQRRSALKGEVPPTAEEYLLSEDAEMEFMGRELLIRFFGFQVPGA